MGFPLFLYTFIQKKEVAVTGLLLPKRSLKERINLVRRSVSCGRKKMTRRQIGIVKAPQRTTKRGGFMAYYHAILCSSGYIRRDHNIVLD